MAESIFTGQTPSSPDVLEGGGINTAVTFVPAVSGTVTGIRFFAATTVAGTYTGSLYLPTADDDPEGSGAGTLLGSAVAGVAPTGGAWNVIPLSSPVVVTAGVPYRAAVHSSAGRYVSTGNFFNGVSVTNGNLTAPATGTNSGGFGSLLNGVFRVGALGYPSNTFNGGNYFVDVVFEAAALPGEGEADFPLVITVTATGETPGPGRGAVAFTLDLAMASAGVAPDPTPDDTGVCGWTIDPVELGVCADWESRPEAVRTAALEMATLYLWAATARQFGICPVTVRPQQGRDCGPVDGYRDYPVIPGQSAAGGGGGPYLFAGRWFNGGCDTGCCSDGCAVVLDGPVASVTGVVVDGELLTESAYRVDAQQGQYLLMRTDGSCWPTCAREPGSFEVSYMRGRAVPRALQVAAALLACEYAKHLAGGACALPARMTRLSRQGVEVEVDTGSPNEGTTGIRQVDDVIAAYNPGRRQSPPAIFSLDLPTTRDRMTIWGA